MRIVGTSPARSVSSPSCFCSCTCACRERSEPRSCHAKTDTFVYNSKALVIAYYVILEPKRLHALKKGIWFVLNMPGFFLHTFLTRCIQVKNYPPSSISFVEVYDLSDSYCVYLLLIQTSSTSQFHPLPLSSSSASN